MSELKLPRLLAAAKEFNVGQDTLVNALAKRGFNKDGHTATTKLTEDMYYALQAEFQGDKNAKNKANQVEIPKGQQSERKRRDEEEITFRKDFKPSAPVVVAAPKEEPTPVVVPAFIAPPSPVVVEAIVAPVPTPAPVVEVKVEVAPPPPEPIVKESKEVEEPTVDITRIEAPELEGPKVLGTVDLSAIDNSTRPKKGTKKKEESIAPAPVARPIVEAKPAPVVVAEKAPKPAPISIAIPIKEQAPVIEIEVDNAPVIENIEVEKLTGPKILGKIELPIDSDTRPKPMTAEERKIRKRIPVDNRRVGSAQPYGGQQGGGNFQNRGPQQGGQGGGQNRGGNPAQAGNFRSVPSAAPVQAPGTGNSRPIVAANNRSGGSGGGGFSRGPQGGGGNRPSGGFNRDARPAGGRGAVRRDDKEIDAKEIQDKIKETQAKLAGGGGRGKSLKAKYRRAKRDEAAEAMNDMDGEDNKLQVTEFVTVSELANLMDVSFADVIGKCMGLGIMVSINQRLDAEVIELVASEFDFEVEFIGVDDIDDDNDDEDDENSVDAETRPPIVTIMGHVDHGKTSLLDYIRNANVVAGEAGGITQHIGAYEVTLPNGKAITFLDTPGHEAFTAMRARGAKVTDIAVIVVAADDAVMPQTKEAISHAQAAGVPMIFAVNKIDKDGANPQKIYEQLAGMNILVESWGGKFQSQELSAKQGLNVDLLLDKILFEAELLDVKANAEKDAVGSIIEASLDKGRGYVATILVQN
ncbi:MAG: translation initiation factor IF-2 N-terminal domain-containing protein, partial [Pedobacter sp.]|nr:translation initiation factor IF-2 N-terminal domain-containing protein [Chitinophagaceae bacterium]